MNTGAEAMQNGAPLDETLKPATIMYNFHTAFHALAMLAGMQLDVFTPLQDGPMEVEVLASALGVQEAKLVPLLYSLVAAGLLKVENERFSNTEEASVFLVRGRPEYIGGLSGLYTMFLTAALKTAETIRTGEPHAKFDFRTLSDEELLAYFRKQVHSSINGGKEIVDKFDFAGFERLLDAGGGTGGVSIAICTKYPRLKATVADLPTVAKLSEHFIAEAGMSGKIAVSPIDLCSDSPSGQYDVAVLRAFIQTLSKEEALAALKHIGQSMVSGGRIFIFGSVLKNSRLAPPVSVVNDLVFLNVYDHGRSYTENEYQEMLVKTGFTDITVEHEVLVGGMGLIEAKKQ
jgi:hypothetical protein